MKKLLLFTLLLVSSLPASAQRLKWEVPLVHPSVAFDRYSIQSDPNVITDGSGGAAVLATYDLLPSTIAAVRITWVNKAGKGTLIDLPPSQAWSWRIVRLNPTFLYVIYNNDNILRRYQRRGTGTVFIDTPLANGFGTVKFLNYPPPDQDRSGFFGMRVEGNDPPKSIVRYVH